MEDQLVDPIPLQDLCLLVVINDLTTYPVSLLASMPRWFRHRLLSNLPVIDLCLLDHSPVARGIDINEIWKIRSRRLHGRLVAGFWGNYTFELPSECWRLRPSGPASICSQASELEGLEPKLKQALQNWKSLSDSEVHLYRTQYLMEITRGLLLLYDCYTWLRLDRPGDNQLSNLEAIARECVSMSGSLLLQDLTKVSNISHINLPSYAIRRSRTPDPWSLIRISQLGIPISELILFDVEITPQRYMTVRDSANRIELMTLINQSFHLKAPSISLNLPLLRLKCQSDPQELRLLQYLISDVQVLGLHNSMYINSRFNPQAKQDSLSVHTIMEICVGSGIECKLGALNCSLQNFDIHQLSPYLYTLPGDNRQPHYSGLSVLEFSHVYTDFKLTHAVRLIQQHPSLKYVKLNVSSKNTTDECVQCFTALASLFHRPYFQVLHLTCTKNMDLITLLVHEFMSAPCSGSQQLSMHVRESLPGKCSNAIIPPHNRKLKTPQDCGIEHKRLLSASSDLSYTLLSRTCPTSILEVLLQFPSIRLKDLMFECIPDAGGNYPFLHLAALHPDLRLCAIFFHFNRGLNQQFLLTIKEDFKKLFSMPTLKEISINGYWDEFPEIVQALILGLATVKSLNKISLASQSTKCTEGEHIAVWNSLSALPRLDELEVIIKGYFGAKVKECAHLICDNWKQSLPARRRMKSIQLRTTRKLNNEDYDFLSEICESYFIIKI